MFLSHSACRTGPIIRNVLKSCSRCNSVLRVALFRIIDVSAEDANISFHTNKIKSECERAIIRPILF